MTIDRAAILAAKRERWPQPAKHGGTYPHLALLPSRGFLDVLSDSIAAQGKILSAANSREANLAREIFSSSKLLVPEPDEFAKGLEL